MSDKTIEFINKGNEIHGDKYDYSKVVYENNLKNIIIICKEHGEFLQTPKSHKKGSGCRSCANERVSKSNKLNDDEFIIKANEVHNNKYDYSKVNYINSHTKVIIICKKHEDFEQTPNSHLRGQGCSKCGNEKISTLKKSYDHEFITKANETHNNKYDYSKIEYIDSHTKVIITCKKHGDFEQTPNSHLCGQGCSKCKNENTSNRMKSNKDEFIIKANEVHNNEYDYSKVDYINSQTKVIITCKEHGDFEQIPTVHLRGSRCSKCIGRLVTNKTEFIIKANEVHNNKYDYSKVEYINSLTKVIITCKEHGDFEQTPTGHLNCIYGCQKCYGKLVSNQNEFIIKANEIHNNKYDYSKVEYINSQTKVTVICKEHGDFEQIPNSHLCGYGCRKCGNKKISKSKKSNDEEFIIKANEIHNNKYDYSKVEYIDSQTKVIIICKEHGDFEQIPSSHLCGYGCKRCGVNKMIEKQMFSNNDFIKTANEIHNNKYDYSKVNYTGANNEIIIICKEHGEFKQKPSKHINTQQGCIKCAGTYQYTIEDFINKSIKIHGNKYDYTKTNYINSHTKVIITCKKCGDFEQLASEHYNGSNCPRCVYSNYSKKSIEYLNFISKLYNIRIQHAENVGEYKIKNIGKADGYCQETNTIYEYHGDFWHGNPKKYNQTDINKKNGSTFGELYQKTLDREQKIKDMGFNLVTIWESDWIKLNKSIKVLQRKYRNCKLKKL